MTLIFEGYGVSENTLCLSFPYLADVVFRKTVCFTRLLLSTRIRAKYATYRLQTDWMPLRQIRLLLVSKNAVFLLDD